MHGYAVYHGYEHSEDLLGSVLYSKPFSDPEGACLEFSLERDMETQPLLPFSSKDPQFGLIWVYAPSSFPLLNGQALSRPLFQDRIDPMWRLRLRFFLPQSE